jgi:IMP cyclohydrolase
MYRVSSRSFPNRTAVIGGGKVSIVPKPGYELDVHKNPYIAYNCVRIVCGGEVAVVTNGSQTDPIAEKIDMGMPVRDAIVLSTLALDYEKDSFNTPRVTAVVDRRSNAAWLGIIRHDGIEVERIALKAGRLQYVATYEENMVTNAHVDAFAGETVEAACECILREGVFADRENPVTAVAAMAGPDKFELFAKDAC